MLEKEKQVKVPNENGRNGKPISLYPMSVKEALKKAMQADPKNVPDPKNK